MIKNNRGFTLVEVMVGVGLMAVVTIAVVTTQVFITKDQVNLRNQLDQAIDQTLAERIIFMDFSTIEPSYNNINVFDDNKVNFFDYYPDVPANSVQGGLTRTITLKGVTGYTQSVMLASQNTSLGATLVYDPTAAYDIGADPADFNQPAPLNFKGLNNNSWLTSESLANRPGFWKPGVVLMLDTPAKLRPLLANGTLNMSVPPRSPIFVGSVNSPSLSSISGSSDVGSLFKMTQPDTGAAITSADNFFRTAPSIGGGQTLIRLKALKVIKYYMTADQTMTADCVEPGGKAPYYHSSFYKETFESGKWGPPVMLADKICSFVMYRDSVLKRMIYFKLVKVKDLKKGTATAGL